MAMFRTMGLASLLTVFMTWSFVSVPLTCYADQNNTMKSVYSGKSKNFAVMVSDTLHFKVALTTAEQLRTSENKFNFEIVVVGELAKALVEDKQLVQEIDKAEKLGVKIVVCEIALAFFNVPKEKLDKRISTTKNAWIYMFELKDKNYNTLTI